MSANVKRLIRTWEEKGAIGGQPVPSRKDAIRRAVTLALRAAGASAGRAHGVARRHEA